MPTKDDYLTQIDADLANETEDPAALKERRAAVERAKSDSAAASAYFEHLAKTQSSPPPDAA